MCIRDSVEGLASVLISVSPLVTVSVVKLLAIKIILDRLRVHGQVKSNCFFGSAESHHFQGGSGSGSFCSLYRMPLTLNAATIPRYLNMKHSSMRWP